MGRLLVAAALALLSASSVFAQQADMASECGAGKQCPEDKPCCSQYGQCGVGAFCLGGCDPLNSHSLDSCVPAPVCNSEDYKFNSLDKVAPNTKYLGDSSKSNWVSSGQPELSDGNVVLTLSETGDSSFGTLLASTSYVWYGKISTQMKSSRGQGVVTAFILMSDVKDEIDFEFVGTDLRTAQSNFYFQGIPDYDNGQNLSVKSSTFDEYHTYEIDWSPTQLTWSVDGEEMRTVKKSDTWNTTTNQYHYPQTPSRVQLSLWPAGSPKNGQGTINWAGGLVNWNAQDPASVGYYYSMIKDISVECYPVPNDVKKTGSKSYVYTKESGLQDSVVITNEDTVLKSLLGTGTDMDKDYPKAKSSATAANAAATSEVATVPGLTGAGPGTNGHPGNDGNVGTVAETGGGSGSGDVGDDGTSSAGIGGFSQGNNAQVISEATSPTERGLQSSMFAALVAILGLLVL
ncbi:MAG: hypothetical protein LQ348_003504 [Seirophora lacunosa]|nr:MAG: hypothetical protein LQ344_005996 [Seirophora lacunosa]KAI4191550.1 MAG: hypothetical protein LQ348_003504 [Seirophora lacunosa]